MPQLIVTYDELKYGDVMFRKGDKFFASQEDARLLVGFGKAGYLTMATEPEDPQPTVIDNRLVMPRKKRSYRRRDMKAER